MFRRNIFSKFSITSISRPDRAPIPSNSLHFIPTYHCTYHWIYQLQHSTKWFYSSPLYINHGPHSQSRTPFKYISKCTNFIILSFFLLFYVAAIREQGLLMSIILHPSLISPPPTPPSPSQCSQSMIRADPRTLGMTTLSLIQQPKRTKEHSTSSIFPLIIYFYIKIILRIL